MRRFWIRIRMPITIVALLIVTIAMARLFSGPEDTWIKNNQGEWVMHGNPSGPPPAEDYREPPSHLYIPLAFFAAFAVSLLLLGSHTLRDRLNYETAVRDVKSLGFLGTSLFLCGFIMAAGLVIELSIGGNGDLTLREFGELNMREFLIIVCIAGCSLLSILFGALCYGMKRTINDHYQLAKRQRELMELLEGHAQ